MLGLSALAYALLHLSLYCLEEGFVWSTIVSEIVLRIYLTIGFFALCGLVALGVTSNGVAIRWLGAKRWNRLHLLVYAIGVLGLVHYFIQLRLDATQASVMAGFFCLVMGFRIVKRAGVDPNVPALLGLALASGLATALIEAGYYRFATGANAALVLEANLHFAYSIRPAWQVAAGGVALALLKLAISLRGRLMTPWRGVRADAASG